MNAARRPPATQRQEDARAIVDAVRILFSEIRVFSHEVEARQGISGAQFFVLQQLAEGGELSINDLAARTRTHQSSVSVVVARLKEGGLVVARPSKEDRRRLGVALTAKGTRVVRGEGEPLQVSLFAALDRLPLATHQQLAHGLRAWLDEVGLQRKVAPMFFEEKRRPEDKPARRRKARA
jgi:DNA-binding MarR family transcriptional regulator